MVILIVLLLLSYWIYRLKKEINFRKHTEKKLVDEESSIHNIHKYALIGHWEMQANGATLWSESMYQLLGLPPTAKAGPESFSTVTTADDFSVFRASLDNSFATGKEHFIQCKIQRPSDNKERWIDCRGKVTLDDNGNPYKISGFIQDITEQKVSFALLRESEDKYRALFETALIGMVLNDKDGRLLEVNQAYLDIIGYTKEEALELTYWDLTPPRYKAEEYVQLNSLKEKGRYGPYEKEYIHKDGHLVPVMLSGVNILRPKNEPYIWSSVHDITARKQEESREKYRAHVLELIMSEEPLPIILNSIVRLVEENNPEMLCSILLLDEPGEHLLIGAAPSLPDFYNEAIHGVEIGDGVGSCGTAAFTNKRVVVEDIQSHPYWTNFKELAAKAELGACWCEPVRSTKGEVLGTFAIYHHDIHQPTESNIALIEQSASLASIAVEKISANIALRASDEQMQLALAGAELGFWDWHIVADKIERNERWATMLGYTHEEVNLNTNQWADYVHPQDKDKLWRSINDVLEGRSTLHCLDYRMVTKEGDYRWVHVQANVMQRDDNGKPLRMSGIHCDITHRKEAEENMKLAASVFTSARESIVITDASGLILDVNDTFTTTTGYSREESIGKNPRILNSGRQSPEFYSAMWQALLTVGYWSGEMWNRHKNGEVYAAKAAISAVRDEFGSISHYVALSNDITLVKEHQNQLERIAHYDVLTDLPNRSLLADRLSQAMLLCGRREQSLAVVFLDLDGFKAVNDHHGHDVGDQLLISLSARMKEALREGDTLSRIGGDEFVAVLTDLANVEDCEPLLERLLLAVSEPITIGDVVLSVSASLGVTLYPQDDADADQLMRHADQAMYVAKGSGKNRYHLFDTVQDDAIKIQRERLEEIRSALDNQQFILHYQPKVNMRTGAVVGVEALIRWQHPTRGLLEPIEFLPFIENNPMSIEVGEWVIDTALTQISQWQVTGLSLPLNTSVNIAAVQLQQTDFTCRLTKILSAHADVNPRYLQLEVLETSALEDVQHVSKAMNACMSLGVSFALDDFGTGYSSLTYLRRFPANTIKIDQSFVQDMLSDENDLAIVEGVITLAKLFKLEVIAEGVETVEHGTALLQLGCELAQGYGIAKPMPVSELAAWLGKWKPDDAWNLESNLITA